MPFSNRDQPDQSDGHDAPRGVQGNGATGNGASGTRASAGGSPDQGSAALAPGSGDPQGLLDRHRDLPFMERLRLLAQAGCTGSLIITDDITLGVIFLHEGAVIDAIVTDGPWIGEGVQAVAFLANLESGHITYETTSHFGKPTVDVDLAELEVRVEQIRPLLMPVLRAERAAATRKQMPRATEQATVPEAAAEPTVAELVSSSVAPAGPDAEPAPGRPPATEPAAVDPAPAVAAAQAHAADPVAAPNPAPAHPERKDRRMAPLESTLVDLRDIRGYLGSGVLDATGDLLAADSVDGVDIALMGALYTDLLRSADEASRRLGMAGCNSTTLHTDQGVVVLRRVERVEYPPVYLIGVVKPDGNPALLRMQLDQLAPRVLARLA